jgi:hypothetical protein
MGDEHIASHSHDCLCFILYQLRDDLAELLFGLESGQMSREQVVAGTKAELEQVFKALSDHDGLQKLSLV